MLCEMLGLTKTHPVYKRSLRNDWMHFDQRIDQEVMSGRDVPIGFFILSRRHPIEPLPARILRLLDPRTATIHILGERYSLDEIASSVQHVNERAAEVLTLDQLDVEPND
jgi:hypothetical protein